MNTQSVEKLFADINIDPSWAFADKTRKDTAYITHGYHRYPAKFIPQIASRLIQQYTKQNDLVVDPFGGCGTTLVEAKTLIRSAIGVDINPVAVLITKAKKTALDPANLEIQFLKLKNKIDFFDEKIKIETPQHQRIDYWFKEEQKKKLAYLFARISKIEDQDMRDFFYCAFSNILKNCSIWMQKSNKPTRDFNKIPSDPFTSFLRQTRAMLKGNIDFFRMLEKRRTTTLSCEVHCADARAIPAKNNSVRLIVTSPPYVTSYEYADLHQLTALWFEYTKDLSDFRKRFIGTAHHNKKKVVLNSTLAENIEQALLKKHKKTAEEVTTYFSEMNQAFLEMHRVLKKTGRACIVIGNTSLKGVKILNAEVFAEQLQAIGFRIEKIIKREIPSKILPSVRDKKTGRFTKISDKKKIIAYPTEYILIAQKQ